MSAPKHTPGPWAINKYGSIGSGAHNACPIIASVEPFYGVDKRFGDSHANAQLIAAAPELYAALAELIDEADFDQHPNDFMPVWHRARTALRKAHGETS